MTIPGAALPLGVVAPAGTLLGNTMTPPIPSITGGAAAPSNATSGGISNYIYAVSGSGMWFWLSLAALGAYAIWKAKK